MRSAATRCRRRARLLDRASSDTGLPEPPTLAGWAERIDAWTQNATALSAMTPEIYELDLQATCEALAPAGRGGFGRLWAAVTSARYRAARARLRTAVLRGRKLDDRELYASAVAGRDSARKWSELGGRGNPAGPAHPGRVPGVLPAPTRPARPAGNLVSTPRPGRDADRGLPARAGQARRRPGDPGQAPGAAPAARLPERGQTRRVRSPLWQPGRHRRNSPSGRSGTPGSAPSWTISR